MRGRGEDGRTQHSIFGSEWVVLSRYFFIVLYARLKKKIVLFTNLIISSPLLSSSCPLFFPGLGRFDPLDGILGLLLDLLKPVLGVERLGVVRLVESHDELLDD